VAETRPPGAPIARDTVDVDLDRDRDEWLVAECAWPPERRIVDVDRPVDLVAPAGDPVGVLGDGLVVDERPHRDRPGIVAVEVEVDEEVRSGLVGVSAQDSTSFDPGRTGVVDPDRSPKSPWVPGPVDPVPVLEHAGDVALAVLTALWRTGDLDGEDVLVGES
jgi:hypothetical protein